MEDRRADDNRNRRVRNRTHGGVVGGSFRPLPDSTVFPETVSGVGVSPSSGPGVFDASQFRTEVCEKLRGGSLKMGWSSGNKSSVIGT